MNKKIRSGLVALLAVGLLSVSVPVMAESAENEKADLAVDQYTPASKTKGYDGVVAAVGVEAAFQVVSVSTDATSHVMVLADKAGTQKTFKLGPEVKNFNQLKAGDYVVVSENAQLVLFYDKTGQVPSFGQSVMVLVAPKGAKPGLIIVEKSYVTLQITAVDAANKTVTITLPDNTVKTISAPKADYTKIKTGHDVIVQQSSERSIMAVPPK